MHENQWRKFIQSQQWKHKNKISDIALMSLLSISEVRYLGPSPTSLLEQLNREKVKVSTWF